MLAVVEYLFSSVQLSSTRCRHRELLYFCFSPVCLCVVRLTLTVCTPFGHAIVTALPASTIIGAAPGITSVVARMAMTVRRKGRGRMKQQKPMTRERESEGERKGRAEGSGTSGGRSDGSEGETTVGGE